MILRNELTLDGVNTNKFLQDIIETSRDLIAAVDTDCTLLVANRYFKEMLLMPDTEIPGQNLRQSINKVHPFAAFIAENCREKLLIGKSEIVIKSFTDGQGKLHTYEITFACNRDNNGNITSLTIRLAKVLDNYAADPKSNQIRSSLQEVFNLNEELIFSIDVANQRFVTMSEACEQLYGYTQQEFLDDFLLWQKLVLPEDQPKLVGIYEQLLRGEISKLQYRLVHKTKGIRWFEHIVIPTLTPNGNLVWLDGTARDITDKKQMEEELQEAQGQIKNLLESLEDVVFSVDIALNKMAYISPACEKMYGYTPQEFYNTENIWGLILHPDEMPGIDGWVNELVKGGMIIREFKILHKSGDVRYVEDSLTPVFSENGVLERIDGVSRDVTDKKKLEIELEITKHEMESLLASLDDVIFSYDVVANKASYISPSCLTNYGYTQQEIYDMPSLIETLFAPDDVPNVYEAIMSLRPGLKIVREFKIIKKTGEMGWVEDNVRGVFDEQGNLVRVEGIGRDITEKKLLEQKLISTSNKLTAVLESIDDIVFTVDVEVMKVKYMSPAAFKLYGYSPEEFYADSNLWLSSVYPDDLHVVHKQIEDLNKGFRVFNEYRIINKKGEIRCIENRLTPALNNEGKLIRLDGVSRDVTDKKEKDRQLAETAARMSSILNSMEEGFIAVDFNWNITQVNAAVLNAIGIKEEDVIGKNIWVVMPALKESDAFGMAHDVMETGKPQQLEFLGKVIKRWIDMHIFPYSGGVAAFFKDVQNRKETELALLEANNRYEIVTQVTRDVIYDWDIASNMATVSKGHIDLFGYGFPDNKVSLEEWSTYLHPDDLGRLQLGIADTLQNKVERWEDEYRHVCADGTYKYIHDRAHITYNAEGQPVKMIGIMQDITERKLALKALRASEANLLTVIHNTSTAYVLFDLEYNILLFNEQAQMLTPALHFKPFTVGTNLLSIMPEQLHEAQKKKMQSVIDGENLQFEVYQPKPDGSPASWYYIRWTRITDDEGRTAGLMFSAADITEIKKKEEEIRLLNDTLEKKVEERTRHLEEANKELEMFSYSASHDLRAPLRVINGFAEILLEDYLEKLDGEGQKYLKAISRNANHMGHLIDDLLNFSHMGRVQITKQQLDMYGLVKTVVHEFTSNAGDKQLPAITLHKIPAAKGDINLVKQVWVNLLSNAIKYSSKKINPEIEIGCNMEDNHAVYYIKDNGAGFDMKYSGRLFNVFQRLHKPSDFEGTGVGLALVNRIITRHGGKIWAEGTVDGGATFYFTMGK